MFVRYLAQFLAHSDPPGNGNYDCFYYLPVQGCSRFLLLLEQVITSLVGKNNKIVL